MPLPTIQEAFISAMNNRFTVLRLLDHRLRRHYYQDTTPLGVAKSGTLSYNSLSLLLRSYGLMDVCTFNDVVCFLEWDGADHMKYHVPTRLADDIHDGYGSWKGFVCEKRSHGDHSCSSILNFNIFISGHLFWGCLLLDSKVVEVQVSRGLGGLASEVVTTVANTLSLGDGDEGKNTKEPAWLFRGENSKSLGPVGLLWESREVKSKSESSL